MFKWINNWLGSSVTATSATTPTGNEFAALATKSNTTNYAFHDSKSALELVKGTVTACLNAVASERGVLRFVCSDSDIQKVLDRPNQFQSRTDFMEMASLFHDATGEAVIFFVRVDGVIKEAYVIPSFFVTPIFAEASDVTPAGYRWADGRVITEVANLCFIRNNSLKTAPYTGSGFLDDQYDSALLYDLVVRSQKNFFYTGGAPNVALTMKEGTAYTSDQIESIQKMWSDKFNPATGTTNIAVLPPGVEVKNFSTTELNFPASKNELRDEIREAFQVPKIILGDTDNVNHNNGQTALAMFERIKILRWGQKAADALQCYLQREVHSSITVTIDEQVIKTFTQLPTQNGVIALADPTQFPQNFYKE